MTTNPAQHHRYNVSEKGRTRQDRYKATLKGAIADSRHLSKQRQARHARNQETT